MIEMGTMMFMHPGKVGDVEGKILRKTKGEKEDEVKADEKDDALS